MADLRRLHPRLTETDLDAAPFVPELSPVTVPHGDGLVTRPWLDWARRLTLLVSVKGSGGGGGGGESDPTHVVGPAGATPDAIAIYSGSTGKLIKDSLTSIGNVISQAVSQAIAAILPGGKLPVANLPLHKTTHYFGANDPLDIQQLAGYPGSSGVFLNGLGGFTTPAAGVPGPHHLTHEPGGADPLAVDAAAATGSLRTIGTGPLQATAGNDARLTNARVPTTHAASHGAGNSDPVTVTALAGYPGGTTSFLRADGTFAAPAAAAPAAHRLTHEPGGSDPLTVDAAAATGSLRTLGTGANQATAGNDARLSNARTPTAHATTHKSGGSDLIKLDELAAPTDITTLNATTAAHGLMQKYPGGTANFLRADGTFAAPPTGGIPSAHHTTHEPGGADEIVNINAARITSGTLPDARLSPNVALENIGNVFTVNQVIEGAIPGLFLRETDQVVDARLWETYVENGVLGIQPLTDAGASQNNGLLIGRSGHVQVAGNFSAGGVLFERTRSVAVGEWVSVAFNAAQFGGSGGMSWNVAAGNIVTNAYTLIGKTVIWNLSISGSAIVGTASNVLTVAFPPGIVPTHIASVSGRLGADGTYYAPYLEYGFGSGINVLKMNGSPFTIGQPINLFFTVITAI